MKTIFITGASSGIGRATADYFQEQGWNVVATMRSPEKASDLAAKNNALVTRCDVNDVESVRHAIAQGIERFGSIDAVLNNAGYGLVGPFETTPEENVRKQFDTNVFGLMSVMREVLPHFRERGGGTILNVSSMGGRLTFPLYSNYHATKWAVEGLSESLLYELRPLNIRVRLIEPGAIKTDFYGRSMDAIDYGGVDDYKGVVDAAMPRMQQAGATGAAPRDVAKVIFRAANSGGWRLRYPAGGNATLILFLRRILPDSLFDFIVRTMLLRS